MFTGVLFVLRCVGTCLVTQTTAWCRAAPRRFTVQSPLVVLCGSVTSLAPSSPHDLECFVQIVRTDARTQHLSVIFVMRGTDSPGLLMRWVSPASERLVDMV